MRKREERTRPFILKVRVHQLSKDVLMSSLKTFNWTKTIIKTKFENKKKEKEMIFFIMKYLRK
jgi:hypothetical protein